MDKTAKYFDHWANIGRSEDMEKGHGTTAVSYTHLTLPTILLV